jgi:hypothetical protein
MRAKLLLFWSSLKQVPVGKEHEWEKINQDTRKEYLVLRQGFMTI